MAIATDRYLVDDFWSWEYTRRNTDYQSGFDMLWAIVERHSLTGVVNRTSLGMDTFRIAMNRQLEEFSTLPASYDAFIVEFEEELEVFHSKHDAPLRDYKDGHDANTILQHALSEDIAWFIHESHQRPIDLELQSWDEKDRLLISIDLERSSLQRVVDEVRYLYVAHKYPFRDEQGFSDLSSSVRARYSDPTSTRIRESNISRACGLYVWDMVSARNIKPMHAVATFLKKYGHVDKVLPSCKEERRLAQLYSYTDRCIQNESILKLP